MTRFQSEVDPPAPGLLKHGQDVFVTGFHTAAKNKGFAHFLRVSGTELGNDFPVHHKDIVIEKDFFEVISVFYGGYLSQDMVGAPKADIPARLGLAGSLIGTIGATERAAPGGHDPQLRKTVFIDGLLGIEQFPVFKGQFIQLCDKRPGFITDDIPILSHPQIFNGCIIPVRFQGLNQIQQSIFAFPDANGIQTGYTFQTKGIAGGMRTATEGEHRSAVE
jgi:hypothetical protein